MTAVPLTHPKEYRPGDRATTTGVYRASHFRHRMPHELTVLEGETFPGCRKCGEKVKFELVHAAPRLKGDLDLLLSLLAVSSLVLCSAVRF